MDASFRFRIFLKLTKSISKSSYLPANSRTKPNFVHITAETSSAGGQGGRAWCSRYSLLHITHAPLSAHSTPFGLVSDSYTLGTPSWLPVRLAGEAPGLKTGSLVWIYAAPWVKTLDHSHSMLCTLLPTDTEQSQHHLWVALFIVTLAGNILEHGRAGT